MDISNPLNHEQNNSFELLLNCLKTNSDAIVNVLSTKTFTMIAILSTLLISLINTITFGYIAIKLETISFSQFSNMMNVLLVMFSTMFIAILTFSFSYNLLLNFINIKEEKIDFLRITTIYTPFFLVVDTIIISLVQYYASRSVSPNMSANQILFSNIAAVLYVCLFAIIFIHLAIVTLKTTQLSPVIILILIFVSFCIALIMGYYAEIIAFSIL